LFVEEFVVAEAEGFAAFVEVAVAGVADHEGLIEAGDAVVGMAPDVVRPEAAGLAVGAGGAAFDGAVVAVFDE